MWQALSGKPSPPGVKVPEPVLANSGKWRMANS